MVPYMIRVWSTWPGNPGILIHLSGSQGQGLDEQSALFLPWLDTCWFHSYLYIEVLFFLYFVYPIKLTVLFCSIWGDFSLISKKVMPGNTVGTWQWWGIGQRLWGWGRRQRLWSPCSRSRATRHTQVGSSTMTQSSCRSPSRGRWMTPPRGQISTDWECRNGFIELWFFLWNSVFQFEFFSALFEVSALWNITIIFRWNFVHYMVFLKKIL